MITLLSCANGHSSFGDASVCKTRLVMQWDMDSAGIRISLSLGLAFGQYIFVNRAWQTVETLDCMCRLGKRADKSWWRHQMETFSAQWPFVRGFHRSAVNSPHKGQWRGALMFSLIWAWINGSVNNREAGDLRRHRTHYDVSVMITRPLTQLLLALICPTKTVQILRLHNSYTSIPSNISNKDHTSKTLLGIFLPNDTCSVTKLHCRFNIVWKIWKLAAADNKATVE